MEAEGVLVSNTFPFCAGMGAPSSSNFGLPVLFSSKLVGISLAISSNSNDINSSVSFTIEHYKQMVVNLPHFLQNHRSLYQILAQINNLTT
jgi:hypothetical protein